MPRLLDLIVHQVRQATGFYILKGETEMIHADVQAQLDRTEQLITTIPTIVQTAVSNAEAAKDADHADDVAALKATNDKLEAALAAVDAPAAALVAPSATVTVDPALTADASLTA